MDIMGQMKISWHLWKYKYLGYKAHSKEHVCLKDGNLGVACHLQDNSPITSPGEHWFYPL